MIKYTVRSRDLVGVYNELKSKRLIPDAYFQRNLVWREIHKQDFIKTILLGYPFPQIFTSKGKIDIEAMQTTSCVVDGQQRCAAIVDYVEDKFPVDGKFFSALSSNEKSDFLKYEIAVIELDMENTDPNIQEIFQRVNRTANSLTAIEKLASEYAPSEFMFFCRILAADLDINQEEEEFKIDPNIPAYLLDWARSQNLKAFQKVILDQRIFTEREVIRKVQLQYVLNIVATILSGYFNRSDAVKEFLDNYQDNFQQKDEMLSILNLVATDYATLKIKPKSMWRSKSSFFTIFIELARARQEGRVPSFDKLSEALEKFENDTPDDYKLAAKEAVNNRPQRILRGEYVSALIDSSL